MEEKEIVAYTESEREKKEPKKNLCRDWFYHIP